MKLKALIIFLSISLVPISYGQTSPTDVQLNAQVQKIGLANKLTVIMHSGDEYHGTIKKIETESFEITEVDQKQVLTIKYSEIKKIRKGYGSKGINGKRINPRNSLIVGVTFIGGLIGFLFWSAKELKKS